MTKQYSVEVLKDMLNCYTANIISSSKYNYPGSENRLAELISNRRLIASMIENDGVSVVPSGWRNGNVFFDIMLYSACSGSDTSWW